VNGAAWMLCFALQTRTVDRNGGRLDASSAHLRRWGSMSAEMRRWMACRHLRLQEQVSPVRWPLVRRCRRRMLAGEASRGLAFSTVVSFLQGWACKQDIDARFLVVLILP